MIRARRVAGGGADAAILLADQRIVVQRLVGRVAPVVSAHLAVQPFGAGFGEAVGERLQHDRVIVVVCRLELGELLLDAEAGGDGEGADPVGGAFFCHKIGKRLVRLAGRTLVLLAQVVPGHRDFAARFVGIDLDVVADRVGRVEAENGVGRDPFLSDQFFQHRLAIGKDRARRLADDFVVKNLREGAGEIPGLEEGAPVDVLGERRQIDVAQYVQAGLGRRDRRVGRIGVPGEPVRLRFGQRDQRDALLVGVLGAHALVIGGDFFLVACRIVDRQQLGDDADGARGVRYVNNGAFVVRRDLDRRMRAAGRRSTDEERHVKTLPLHLGGDVAHLFQRRRDQSGEADRLRAVFFRRVQDLVARDHDAEVDHFVAVATEHDADDVLADVVHVALDGRHDDATLAGRAGAALFFLDVRDQVRDRLLHDARRLHDLRQKHLAGAEEVADDVHAAHQRAFDHRQRRLAGGFQRGAAFLGIGDDKVGDALDQRVFEPLLDRQFTPTQIGTGVPGLAFLDCLGELHQSFAGVRRSVQDDRFDLGAQHRIEIVVDADHAGVDDAHRQPGLDRVVEENRVDRLAHRVVAAERERDVGNAAGNLRMRQVGTYPAAGLDEVDGVVVVFLDAGGDGEDVRVEDDVLGGKSDAHQQLVGALADLDLAPVGVGLALLVEGHDDHRRAVTPRQPGLLKKLRFSFLHRDRIDDALALDALQAGLDDFPLRRVEHHRHARNVGFRRDQLEEAIHRGDRVEHRLVHVDVDHLRAVLDLLAGDGQRIVEAAFKDHLGEDARAGDVGPLADVHEQRFRADVERFQAREAQLLLDRRDGARLDRLNLARDGGDVLGRGAAAAADDVDEAMLRPVGDLIGQLIGRLVVAAEGVGQAGVRVRRDVAVADARQLLDVLAQFISAERAVESERQRLDMAERVPEGFGGLARERAPGSVGDRAGDHHRPAAASRFEKLFDGEQRGLGVEGVEDRFDEQDVGAAVGEAANRLGVADDEVVEADVAIAGVVDVGRDRRRARGRAEDAGDEARLCRILGSELFARLARQSRAGDVQLIDDGFEVVVGLRQRRGVEGAGFEDVGAGRQIFGVDAANDLGLGQQ